MCCHMVSMCFFALLCWVGLTWVHPSTGCPWSVQMAKLDSDPSSAAARTSSGAPAKGAAAPATVYNPRVDTLYESFFNLPAVKAALPPEAPEQAAQDPPKLPGRKPPGSIPAPKHGDVLNMLSRYTTNAMGPLRHESSTLYMAARIHFQHCTVGVIAFRLALLDMLVFIMQVR